MAPRALSIATGVIVAAALALAATAELRLEAPPPTVLLVDGGAERAVSVLRRGEVAVREARVVDVDAAGAGLWAAGEVTGVDAGGGWTNYSAVFVFESGLGVGRWAFEVTAVDGGVERVEGEWVVAGVVLRRGGEVVSGLHRSPVQIGTWADVAADGGVNAALEFDVELAAADGTRVEQIDGVVVSAAAALAVDGLDHAQVVAVDAAAPGLLAVSLAPYRVGDGVVEIDVSVAGIEVAGEAPETVVRLAYDTRAAGPPPPVVAVGAGGRAAVGDDGVLEVAAFNLRAPPAEADVTECVLQVGGERVAWDAARGAMEEIVDQRIVFDVGGARGRANVSCDGREAAVLWAGGDGEGARDYFEIVDAGEGEGGGGGVGGVVDPASDGGGDGEVEGGVEVGGDEIEDGTKGDDDGENSGKSSGSDGDSNGAGQGAGGNVEAGGGDAASDGANDVDGENGDPSDGRDDDDEDGGSSADDGDGNGGSAGGEVAQPTPEPKPTPTEETEAEPEPEVEVDVETGNGDRKPSNSTTAVSTLQPPLEEKEGQVRMMSQLRVVSGDPVTYSAAEAEDILEAVCHFTEATECTLTNVTKGSAILDIESYVSLGSESSVYKLRSAIETCALQKRVRVACDEIELQDWTMLSAASTGADSGGISGGSGADNEPISAASIAIAAVAGVMTIVLLVVAGAWIVYRRHEEQLESDFSSSGPFGVPESDDSLYQQAIVRDIYGRGDAYGTRRVVQQDQHRKHLHVSEASQGEADGVGDDLTGSLSSSVASSFFRPPSSDFCSSAYSV